MPALPMAPAVARVEAAPTVAAHAAVPAAVDAQAAAEQEEPASRPKRNPVTDALLATLLSTAFHLCVFILLALYVSAGLPQGLHQVSLVAIERADDDVGAQQSAQEVLTMHKDPAQVLSQFVAETAMPLPIASLPMMAVGKPLSVDKALPSPDELGQEAKSMEKALQGGAIGPRLLQVASAQQAMDGVLGEVAARAGKDRLLVVWLVDASLSLSDDRQQIASRLATFFREQETLPEEKRRNLTSAVVAFGAGANELEPPTRFGQRIVEAIGRVQNDTSGAERTFATVKWAVERYARHKGQVMFVVWTDESGDDQQDMEATIQTCTKQKVTVSVVGPTSVLGRIYGTQSWPNPAGGRPLALPVTRGPDSPAPERLLLPYWFDSRFPSWGRWGDGPPDEFPRWYGGPQMEYMLCGLGPYALVRLAMATGGTYTLLDRPSDRSPFDLDLMKAYLPSYASAKEYAGEVRYHPLRQAVMIAVEITLGERSWGPPPIRFGSREPADLKDQFMPAQAAARRAVTVINRALAAFTVDGMEKQYAGEKSLRWRAWYDLTRGRLLAGLVRYSQYEALLGMFLKPGTLNAATNRVMIGPSPMLGSPSLRSPAAEAERLLKRCLEKNPQTPWAYLAERELDHPLGLDFRQMAVPPPQPRPGNAKPPQPSMGPVPRL